MADISKIQVGSTTYDITDKAQHSDLSTTTKTFVGGINELKSGKQNKVSYTQPSNPQDGDIWIDENDHTGEDANVNAGQVDYDSSESYPNETAGNELKTHSSQISTLQNDISTQSSQIAELETTESQTRNMISDAWIEKTYQPGEYAIYNNTLWKCLVANSSAPSEGENWTAKMLSEELLTVDYTKIVHVTNVNAQVGNFTAPKNGFAFCNLQVNEVGYVDVKVNNRLCSTWSILGGTIAIIPLKKNDVLSWNGSNTNTYMRGENGRSYFC